MRWFFCRGGADGGSPEEREEGSGEIDLEDNREELQIEIQEEEREEPQPWTRESKGAG